MSHAKHPAAALALLGMIACDPVKASLESGLVTDTGAAQHTGETGADPGETGSTDSADSGDTGRASLPSCALVDGALPLQDEGEFLAQAATISGVRARCFTALHAAAGATGSTLAVTLQAWDGASGATLTVTDLLGATLAEERDGPTDSLVLESVLTAGESIICLLYTSDAADE